MLSIIMLSVTYVECHRQTLFSMSVLMLSVQNKHIMLSILMLSVANANCP